MARLSIFLFTLIFLACSNKKSPEETEADTYEQFDESFRIASLPFQLSDTFLIKNKDTAVIRGAAFTSLIPDSTIIKIFGKGTRVKNIPLYKIATPDGGHYYIVKTQTARKKAAFLLIFNKEQQLNASFPFLIPDADAATMQVSSIDKAYSISRSVFLKRPNDVMAEGKDVYVYDKATKNFVLVMTDLLDEKSLDLVNPIDTLSKKHKLAGDYSRDKKNIVSIRDGRKPNLLTVFAHIEKGSDCVGEIKGDATIVSPDMAVYQQPGDPCVLQLHFSGSTVRLSEVEGCGSRRGLGCSFDGSFTRKKQPSSKTPKTKSKIPKKQG
jgi:hypothetical protein